jgi:hypothetical protein
MSDTECYSLLRSRLHPTNIVLIAKYSAEHVLSEYHAVWMSERLRPVDNLLRCYRRPFRVAEGQQDGCEYPFAMDLGVKSNVTRS